MASDILGIIIQARIGSSRLPQKILKDLGGKPVLYRVVERCRFSQKADLVVVATTVNLEDDIIEDFCKKNNIPYFRGSSENVLDRFYQTALNFKLSTIVRANSDCPLIDPETIDRCVGEFEKLEVDYISNVVPGERTFPRGLDVEVFSFKTLESAHQKAKEKFEYEHVTPHIWQNKNGEFNLGKIITAPLKLHRSQYRLCVDYPEDFELINEIYKKFDPKEGDIIDIKEVIKFLDENPEIANINAGCEAKHDKHAPVNIIQKTTKDKKI